MAFIPEEDTQNQQDGMNVLANGQQQQQPQDQGTALSGELSTVQASPQPDQTQKRVQAPKQSGQFTNLRRYIQANAPRAEKLAETIGKGVSGQAQAIGQQLESQRGRFEKSVAGQQQQIASAREFIPQALSEVGKNELDTGEFSRYQGLASGATRFDKAAQPDFTEQSRKAQSLVDLLGRAKRPEGRRDILQQTFSQNAPYTRGQRAIDDLILSSRGDLVSNLGETAKEPVNALERQIQAARKAALEDIYGLRSATAELTGKEGLAFQKVAGQEGNKTALERALDAQVQNEIARRQSRRSEISNKLATGQFLTDQDFEDLGVAQSDRGLLQALATTKSGATGKYGLQNYLNPFDPSVVTRRTVANEQQLKDYADLAKLINEQDLAENQYTGPAIQFNTQDAIRNALNQMNMQGIQYDPNQGLVGEAGILKSFQNALLGANPLLAAPLFMTQGLASTIGSDPLGALDTATTAGDNLINTALTINPFQLDQATKNIIGAGGDTILSAGEIAKRLTPDSLPGAKVVDAFIGGGTGAVQQVVNQARQAAAAAAAAASRVFCFTEGTKIKMYNGTYKNIEDLQMLEDLYLGGKVLAIGKSVAYDDIYEYKGTKLTANHSVFEDGVWLRVKDSTLATKLETEENTFVYPVMCEQHLLIGETFISADYNEVDEGDDKTPEERLQELNNDEERNYWLRKVEKELYGNNNTEI